VNQSWPAAAAIAAAGEGHVFVLIAFGFLRRQRSPRDQQIDIGEEPTSLRRGCR
jgi:hypothetical protein